MFLILASLLLAFIALSAGWKFYKGVDWDEPAENSPDFGAMRKRLAQLQHIQEVLEDARNEGKLSQGMVQEFNQFCEKETAAMQAEQTAWKTRKR